MRHYLVPARPDGVFIAAPSGRYVGISLRLIGNMGVLGGHSLISVFRPLLRRQFAKYGLGIPAYTFLPDSIVIVAERLETDADLSRAVHAFLRESQDWMRTLGRRDAWDPEVCFRAMRDDDLMGEVRRVLELSYTRNLSNDPYDYPYTGSVGYPIWKCLGDPEPSPISGL